MSPENVPPTPSPEQPPLAPYDPPQPDPQARAFVNRRDWRGHLRATHGRQDPAWREFSAASGWLRNR